MYLFTLSDTPHDITSDTFCCLPYLFRSARADYSITPEELPALDYSATSTLARKPLRSLDTACISVSQNDSIEASVIGSTDTILPITDDPSIMTKNIKNSNTDHTEYERQYLQTEAKIHMHVVWSKPGFWNAALLEGVVAQMTLSNAATVDWDELHPDALREAVVGRRYLLIYAY